MLNWYSRTRLGLTVLLVMALGLTAGTSGGSAPVAAQAAAPNAADLWMAPPPDAVSARARLARAVADFAGGKAEDALPIFVGATWLIRSHVGVAPRTAPIPMDASLPSSAVLPDGS